MYDLFSSEERLCNVLVAREEFHLDRLVQESSLVQQVEADKGTRQLLKLNESLSERRLLNGGCLL